MRTGIIYAVVSVLGGLAVVPTGAAGERDDAFVRQRKELAHRRRRVILNNDGCDALHFPTNKEPTPEHFLALRTTALAGSHVDTLFYCSISSGFSNFTHNTRVGELLTRDVPKELGEARATNITRTLADQGADPLKLVVEFCHKNRIECFWSMRMNDTHDVAHRPEKPYPLFPALKTAHPEYLVGSLSDPPKQGTWSSVDYARPEIRDLAFRYIEEVCRGYDVDGVELDFLRHACYFKSAAYGGTATDAERDLISDLMRRVRAMADAEGRRRGRPILIAIRVPDSVEYSRATGLDVERWLREGLVDLLIGSCYSQLNPWEYLVELGHRYGVPVYPGLSESRVRGEVPPYRRQSQQSYRARALRAGQAGAEGIYLFNFFNPNAPMLRELGDPALLRRLDRDCFVTVRDGDPARYLADGRRYRNLPTITPGSPLPVKAGAPRQVDLLVGDSPAGVDALPEVTLNLLTMGRGGVSVRLNETDLGEGVAAGLWRRYSVRPELVKPGKNVVALATKPGEERQAREGEWDVAYAGTAKPQPPWHTDPPRKSQVVEMREGALLLADRGEAGGDYCYYTLPWSVDPAAESVIEARVRVVSGWNNLLISNGVANERVSLYPDRVAFYEAKREYRMDTTDRFHTYRVTLRGEDIKVYVDDVLRLDGTGTLKAPVQGERNEVAFGAANSPGRGEALWESVKLRAASTAVAVHDIVLSIRYPKR